MASARRSNGDDTPTPPGLAKGIVRFYRRHYGPFGRCLDPCAGVDLRFYNYLPEPRDWCEIKHGRDFLDYAGHVDWIITNPPWSREVYPPIFIKAMEVADNVVFLLQHRAAMGSRWRNELARQAGFGRRTIVTIEPWSFASGLPGLQLVACHWQRGYRGPLAQHEFFEGAAL